MAITNNTKYVNIEDLKGLISDEILATLPLHEVDENTTDGMHTFDELYAHRAVLSGVLFSQNKDIAWKSLKHENEEEFPMFPNMFVCGMNTPEGPATYHYPMEYWDMFDVQELERAPKWYGKKGISLMRFLSVVFKGKTLEKVTAVIDRFIEK